MYFSSNICCPFLNAGLTVKILLSLWFLGDINMVIQIKQFRIFDNNAPSMLLILIIPTHILNFNISCYALFWWEIIFVHSRVDTVRNVSFCAIKIKSLLILFIIVSHLQI